MKLSVPTLLLPFSLLCAAAILVAILMGCNPSNISAVTSRLLAIQNLHNFFYNPDGFDIECVSVLNQNKQKNVHSVAVYRFSSTYQKYLPGDSILFNKKGQPVVSIRPDYSNRFSYTYFFYDEKGNRNMEVEIGSNQYDTTYTLRKFDADNHLVKQIQYNTTRKEYGRLITCDLQPRKDSLIVALVFFDSDYRTQVVLPFESRTISLNMSNDSTVETFTSRIVFEDTSYNSTYTDRYRIDKNRLVSAKLQPVFTLNDDGDWIEMKSNDLQLKRNIYFYKPEDPEIKNDFRVNPDVVKFLSDQMESLPALAFENLKQKQALLKERVNIIEEGDYATSIELKEATALDAFTPLLWNLVSTDSGYIEAYKSPCIVAGYNTPLKADDGSNLRCLAIYECKNGKYILKKQTFGAIETFTDDDEDLLFESYSETNFSVALAGGSIVISYTYMRGEAEYLFSYQNGNWVLDSYQSSHRTCCQAESNSYNYKTREFSSSVFSTSEDDAAGDTIFTIIEERPVIYMDNMNESSLTF